MDPKCYQPCHRLRKLTELTVPRKYAWNSQLSLNFLILSLVLSLVFGTKFRHSHFFCSDLLLGQIFSGVFLLQKKSLNLRKKSQRFSIKIFLKNFHFKIMFRQRDKYLFRIFSFSKFLLPLEPTHNNWLTSLAHWAWISQVQVLHNWEWGEVNWTKLHLTKKCLSGELNSNLFRKKWVSLHNL